MLTCKYGCNRQFQTNAAMEFHRKALHSGPMAAKRIPCYDCGKTFPSVHALRQHQLSKTNQTLPSNGVGSLGCDKCGKTFASVHALRQHQLSKTNHTLPFNGIGSLGCGESCRTLSNEALEKESHISSAAEKNQLQAQMLENRQLREALANQKVLLQHQEAEMNKLVRKHEEETLSLVERVQKEALELAKRRRIEMEREQLQLIMLENGKLFDLIKEDFGHDSKKMEGLEKKLAELQSTQEYQEETIATLAVKERESNDELVDGREMAVQVIEYINEAKRLIEAALEKKGQLDKTKPQKEVNFKQPQSIVEVKKAGAIDETAWPRAFKRKYESDGDWGMKMKEVFSSWEERIRNPEFQPFKTVQIGEDKWEQQIDDENEELAFLKKTHGEEVYNSVTTALMEIEEYNSSGRYPVPVAWNVKKSRKASLKEIIQYLGRIIDSLVAPEVLAHLGRTVESLMGPGASRKRYRN